MMKKTPLSIRLLRLFCKEDLLEDIEGDLNEMISSQSFKSNLYKELFLFREVAYLFRPGIIDFPQININMNMINHYIKSAYRYSIRHKQYTLLNMFSLVLGMMVSIGIFIWIEHEYSKDKFHSNGDRIYKIWQNFHQSNGITETSPGIPQPLKVQLDNVYPEIDKTSLIGWEVEFLFSTENKNLYSKGRYVSPEFLEMFSFNILKGSKENALSDIQNVVISESLAEKLFGEDWNEIAIGSVLELDHAKSMKVSAVIENTNANSTIQFDWLITAQEYIARNSWVENWGNGGFHMYLMLKEGSDINAVNAKIKDEIINNTNGYEINTLMTQKFNETYLYSTIEDGNIIGGRIDNLKIMGGIGVFILILACINFMNLATAKTNVRKKEIGIRKVVGAGKKSLIIQMMTEFILHAVLALLIAVCLIQILFPIINEQSGLDLILDFDKNLIYALFGILVISILFSSVYPSIILSKLNIRRGLNTLIKSRNSSNGMRNILVLSQFIISIFMISASLMISDQLDYLINKNLGLDKDQVMTFVMESELKNKKDVLRNELSDFPEIQNVSYSSGNPLNIHRSTGGSSWEGKPENEEIEINVLSVDHDFQKTLGLEILHGRFFNEKLKSDSNKFVINEKALKIMNFKNPIGKKLRTWGIDGEIIGVVKDFNMASLHREIRPLIIRYDPNDMHFAFVKFNKINTKTLSGVESILNKLNPGFPFRYFFLDETHKENYESEQLLSNSIELFTWIAIVICCLGLYGLTSYATDQKSREIGIRKVLGAKVSSIIMMFTTKFIILLIVAFLIACPIALIFIYDWLESFAFREEPNLLYILAAGILTFVISVLTIGIKSFSSAIMNPVDVLKEE